MKCPNCSAECSDQSVECDFCGHPFVGAVEQAAPAEAPAPVFEAPVLPPVSTISPESPPPVSPYASTPSAPLRDTSIPNHLTWSIIATIIATITTMLSCCCIPLGLPSGIMAIVYAMRVNKFLETGEVHSAEQASKSAKIWAWVTTAIAIIFGILVILSFALQAMGFLDQDYLEDLRKQLESGR